jgi:acylphosphatase
MKAIQSTGKIDKVGQLSLDHPIKGTPPSSVRVIILWEETEVNDFWEQIKEYQQYPLMSVEQLQQELKQSLTEAGYDSREKIVDLVQDIKQEISKDGKLQLDCQLLRDY